MVHLRRLQACVGGQLVGRKCTVGVPSVSGGQLLRVCLQQDARPALAPRCDPPAGHDGICEIGFGALRTPRAKLLPRRCSTVRMHRPYAQQLDPPAGVPSAHEFKGGLAKTGQSLPICFHAALCTTRARRSCAACGGSQHMWVEPAFIH
jgi:hypothetical protein